MASSPRYVAAGAIIAGLSGYAVILVAARLLGAADYVGFSVFWAALYVLIGFLFGIQQEVTRLLRAMPGPTTSPALSASAKAHPPIVAISTGVGLVAAGVVIATTPVWAPAVFEHRWPVFAILLGVAAVLAAVQFAISGALSSLDDWRGFATLVSVEGLVRVTAFLLAAWLIGGVEAMAWATVIAFGASWLWLLKRGRLRELLWRPTAAPLSVSVARIAQAMIAAGASGILINGFPALLAAFSADVEPTRLGVLILVVTLTRAPLMVPLTAFSSVLVTRFVDRRGAQGVVRRPLMMVAVGSVALSLLASALGPPLLPIFFGEQYTADALTFGLLTFASGGLAALTVTGAAVLAANRHSFYVAGWLIAVASSAALLALLPFAVEWRVVAALIIGPLLGMIPHLVALRLR